MNLTDDERLDMQFLHVRHANLRWTLYELYEIPSVCYKWTNKLII